MTKDHQEFVKKYGKRTAAVINCIVKGWSNERIAKKFAIGNMTIAAYKSNLTRGAYMPYVNSKGTPTK